MAYAYAPTAVSPRDFGAPADTPANKPARRLSLWRRLLDALEQSHQRAIEREVAVYLSARGGRLTDRAEREIEEIVCRPTRW